MHKVNFRGLHFKKAGAIIRSVKEKQIPHRKDLPGGIECMDRRQFYETGRKNLIVKRSYKEVYKCEEGIVKVFAKEHPKSDVLNEALNTARVEEAGLDIPSVKEVTHRSMENGLW